MKLPSSHQCSRYLILVLLVTAGKCHWSEWSWPYVHVWQRSREGETSLVSYYKNYFNIFDYWFTLVMTDLSKQDVFSSSLVPVGGGRGDPGVKWVVHISLQEVGEQDSTGGKNWEK